MSVKRWYIIVFIISVIGLAFIQYQYLRVGLNLAKVQFNQKIALAIADIREGLADRNDLSFLVGTAITKEKQFFNLSIDSVQDASRFFLNDFLNEKLTVNGINTEYSYVLKGRDTITYLRAPFSFEEDDVLLKYPFELTGYLEDRVGKDVILELQFKDLNQYFLFQLNGLTIPSLIFLVAIIFVVVWVLRSLYWQRNVITTTNEFINNLTHELKTPVFSIGVATRILEEKGEEKNKEVIGIIRTQVDRLKLQIDKVLELATLEKGKALFRRKKIDFRPNLDRLANNYQELSQIQHFRFHYKNDVESCMLNCEPDLLENAINTLLDNAVKYSNGNAKVVLEVHSEKKMLVVEVSDNGIGIAPEEQQKIFEKYYRISEGDRHEVKGFGIGLSYVKEVVQLNKGNVSLVSTPGEGSSFTVRIPLYYGKQ
ncbi:sensor histidine kinase [Robertkochia solimangrovi]|uniref:sensor histidine kinase n=1 Tax=Robertkochia solimangrovi TaxID=2213046 RepID=UPI00117E95E8|nr:HAMP domain-containing sensor histidine kinase [Robertkochia solimangrovi]TRZ43306.1 two-component sensor histidine kinase [Robertkochia solimangrovi]